MNYTVYIVQCADGSFYTGVTTDVERRLDQHNGLKKGGAHYTKVHGPVTLAYQELCRNRSEALKREYSIKQLTRSEKVSLMAHGLKKKAVRKGVPKKH